MTQIPVSPTETLLRELLASRILILDGAMGTMIQQYKLSEEDYRGERFAGFTAPAGERELFLKGNNELLTLTQLGADFENQVTFGQTVADGKFL